MVKCRVILVGASRPFLAGLSLMLESDDLTVMHIATVSDLLPLLTEIDEPPDFLVWDSSPDLEQDFPRWAEVHREFPEIGIVALTDEIDEAYADRALTAGVRGILPKTHLDGFFEPLAAIDGVCLEYHHRSFQSARSRH
jgi:DNA-binding NarL/FixJ family response regulator